MPQLTNPHIAYIIITGIAFMLMTPILRYLEATSFIIWDAFFRDLSITTLVIGSVALGFALILFLVTIGIV